MDISMRTCCLLKNIILFSSCFFFFFFFNCSNAHIQKELQTAMVFGTVYCGTCSHHHSSKPSHFISGASVSVECNKSFLIKEAKTNQYGVFKIHLPFKLIKSCSVKLIKSSDPHCSIPSSSSLTLSSLRLKSKINGLRVFSAGLFTLCSQQPKPVGETTHHAISEQMQSQQQQQEQQLQPAFFLPPPVNPSPITPTSPTVGTGRVPLPPNPITTQPPNVGGRTPALQPNPTRTPLSPPPSPLAFNYPPFPFPFPIPFPYSPPFPGAPPAPRPKETSP